jgi:hypothetical protein
MKKDIKGETLFGYLLYVYVMPASVHVQLRILQKLSEIKNRVNNQ